MGYFDLIQTGEIKIVSIVFHPHTARFFLNFPLNEWSNTTLSAHELRIPGLSLLEELIFQAPDPLAALQHIEAFLLKRLELTDFHNLCRMETAIQLINSGETDLPRLAATTCLGYKQFKRIFSEYTGVNPKDFLRIIRFQRALYNLQINPAQNLTGLAFQCGFYDQPHLIREFKQFAGCPPREYLSGGEPFSDYFS